MCHQARSVEIWFSAARERVFPPVSPLISSPAADASPLITHLCIFTASPKPLLSPLALCLALGLYLELLNLSRGR